MKKIWTEHDRKLVIAESYRLLEQDPTFTPKRLLEWAQLVLPAHLQRDDVQPAHPTYKWYMEEVGHLAAPSKRGRPSANAKKAPPRPVVEPKAPEPQEPVSESEAAPVSKEGPPSPREREPEPRPIAPAEETIPHLHVDEEDHNLLISIARATVDALREQRDLITAFGHQIDGFRRDYDKLYGAVCNLTQTVQELNRRYVVVAKAPEAAHREPAQQGGEARPRVVVVGAHGHQSGHIDDFARSSCKLLHFKLAVGEPKADEFNQYDIIVTTKHAPLNWITKAKQMPQLAGRVYHAEGTANKVAIRVKELAVNWKP